MKIKFKKGGSETIFCELYQGDLFCFTKGERLCIKIGFGDEGAFNTFSLISNSKSTTEPNTKVRKFQGTLKVRPA